MKLVSVTPAGRRSCLSASAAAVFLVSGVVTGGAFVAAAGSASASVPGARYVSAGGSDAGDCASQAQPCKTIQRAVDVADNGDTVHVGPGHYAQSLRVTGKSVTISGASRSATSITGDVPGHNTMEFTRTSSDHDRVQDVELSAVQARDLTGDGSTHNDAVSSNGVALILDDVAIVATSSVGEGGSAFTHGVDVHGGTVQLLQSLVSGADEADVRASTGKVVLSGSTVVDGGTTSATTRQAWTSTQRWT